MDSQPTIKNPLNNTVPLGATEDINPTTENTSPSIDFDFQFPETLVQLGPCSFMNSGLTNVRFNGESLHILGTKAFQYCHNLRKVSLPKQIDKRGRKVFNGCYYLEKSMQRSKLCHILV